MSDKSPDTDKKNKKGGGKKEAPQITTPDDEINIAVAQSAIKEEKNKKKKQLIKRGAIGGVSLLLIYGIYLLFVPYKGTMAYGICKVFLELSVQYPSTIEVASVEEFATSVRVWYTHSDSFGEYRMEPIQCYFKADDRFGFILDKVTISRREIDSETVDSFNKSLAAVLQNPPDLTLPPPLDDSLKNLHIDINRILRPIF